MKALQNAATQKRWFMSEVRTYACWYDWLNQYALQRRYRGLVILAACIVAAILHGGCTFQKEQRTGLVQAENIASQIHTNMSFREISKIIPLTTNDPSVVRTHGGDWYQVELQDGYYVQLRFNCPVEGGEVHESLLNLPPRLSKHAAAGK